MRICPADGTRLYRVDDNDPLIGGTIDGRFRVDYTLGVGGMGTVYGGVQLSVNRDVAIKVLRTELSNREVALERFFREAKTISKLTHPNIVKLIDFGQDHERGVLYLVMELVRGQNLADLITRGRLRTALALDVVYQVCGALTEPHADNVVHRDLKPDNLLLVPVSDGSMQVKVLDFGIARFMESNTQLTGTGMICGTPAYMAPEQAQNEELDARTDLYALGVILYEMLSGWPPFSGTSSLQVMLKHIQEQPPQLRELLPPATIPEQIERLVGSMLAKERNRRPISAREVRDQIDDLRRQFALDVIRMADDADVDAAFGPFILPKLPRADVSQSGPTQVLRRETGLNPAAPRGISNDTAADPVLGVTGPLSPEQELAVRADAVPKVKTRGGAQQAWTPGDQVAVRAIKDTKDGVDAHGLTAADEGAVVKTQRRTQLELEDSAVIVNETPGTEEIAEVRPDSSKIDTEEDLPKEKRASTTMRPGVANTRSGSSAPYLAIALVALVGVGVAAMFINEKLEALREPAVTTPPPAVPSAEVLAEPAVVIDAEEIERRVEAVTRARLAAAQAVETAAEEPTARTSRSAPRKQPRPPRKPVKTVEEPTPPDSSKKNTDDLVKGLNLRGGRE